MFTRILTVGIIIGGIIIGGVSQAATPRTAKGVIVKALERSSKVTDKQGPFRTKLGAKDGNVRAFTASNVHYVTIPGKAPNGALGGFRMSVGGVYSGTINLKTNRVTVKTSALVK